MFAPLGGPPVNDATATSLAVQPGETLMFATRSAAGIGVNSVIGGPSGNLSARIVATSKKLECTAFVADSLNVPPTTSWQLTIVAKLKQKAAN